MDELPRRTFLQLAALSAIGAAFSIDHAQLSQPNTLFSMTTPAHFDVIIIGGSYSGLAAGMALGRSLRTVLIIDSGKPCNRQTPHSHNFLTRDGETPAAIAREARKQVEFYKSVHFADDLAVSGTSVTDGFHITTAKGHRYSAKKLLFATGVKDVLSKIEGLENCWGISALHCPYCHGYEVRNEITAILANGDRGYDLAQLISNWTTQLTLFTNGTSTLTPAQTEKLEEHGIPVVETAVRQLEHASGYLHHLVLEDGTKHAVKALYTHVPFEQHCSIPEQLGCTLTEDGYLQVDPFQKTSVAGIYASGDCTTRMRTVANAVASGTLSGMMINKELIMESF